MKPAKVHDIIGQQRLVNLEKYIGLKSATNSSLSSSYVIQNSIQLLLVCITTILAYSIKELSSVEQFDIYSDLLRFKFGGVLYD